MKWLRSDGGNFEINSTEIDALWEMAWTIIDGVSGGENEKFQGNLGDYFEEHYNENLKLETFSKIPKKVTDEVKELAHKATMGYFASYSWFDVNTKLTAKYYGEADGDHYLTWRTDGYKTVLDFISVNF